MPAREPSCTFGNGSALKHCRFTRNTCQSVLVCECGHCDWSSGPLTKLLYFTRWEWEHDVNLRKITDMTNSLFWMFYINQSLFCKGLCNCRNTIGKQCLDDPESALMLFYAFIKNNTLNVCLCKCFTPLTVWCSQHYFFVMQQWVFGGVFGGVYFTGAG